MHRHDKKGNPGRRRKRKGLDIHAACGPSAVVVRAVSEMRLHAAAAEGDFRSVSVGQEGRDVRGGGHVRTADGHDTQGVPDAHRSSQRTESRLQRRAIRLPQGARQLVTRARRSHFISIG